MSDKDTTGLYSNGTSNKIDGFDYWSAPDYSNWTPVKKPWYHWLVEKSFLTGDWVLPYRIRGFFRRLLPIRWRRVDGWPLTYHNIDHDELEWKIPRDAGLYKIFQSIASMWGDSGRQEFDNDVFSIHRVLDEEEDNYPTDQYRMVYKPTGLIIEWYKFPFRSSSCNKRFTRKELRKIVKHCMEVVDG